MITEVYKTIEDYPNYEVSNLGNVRNIKTGRVLRPSMDKGGYLLIDLCFNGEHKLHRIHRLVATAFIPNPENKREINHIDGDKTNNYVSNLEWSTRSENMRHAFRTGLNFHSDKAGNPKQKVLCIETGQEFESMNDAGRYFGCGPSSIWQSIYKGYCVKKQYHFELI